jgi:D-alanyl-lipoteichoic acid acyltransferase DltB (MBOAT superfamily)
MEADPKQPRRRDVGWLVLLCVAFGWMTVVAGIGVPFLLGGGLTAVVIAVTDLQDGRRVSRPVLAALLGSLAILAVGFVVSRSW